MFRTHDMCIKQLDEREIEIYHFSQSGLLPADQTLAINLETRTISLLSEGPTLIVEQQLSANELHLFVPILDSFPHYCPYEVLLSHLSTKVVTAASIARCRQRLQNALEIGTWDQEMRPVRNVLSRTRLKLRTFGLNIASILETGCILRLMPAEMPARSA